VQTVIVSLVALAALAFVVRRLVGAILPKRGQAACPSCQAGDHCSTASTTVSETSPAPIPDVRPLVLIRPKSRS
jgi:hypothetical protein